MVWPWKQGDKSEKLLFTDQVCHLWPVAQTPEAGDCVAGLVIAGHGLPPQGGCCRLGVSVLFYYGLWPLCLSTFRLSSLWVCYRSPVQLDSSAIHIYFVRSQYISTETTMISYFFWGQNDPSFPIVNSSEMKKTQNQTNAQVNESWLHDCNRELLDQKINSRFTPCRSFKLNTERLGEFGQGYTVRTGLRIF